MSKANTQNCAIMSYKQYFEEMDNKVEELSERLDEAFEKLTRKERDELLYGYDFEDEEEPI